MSLYDKYFLMKSDDVAAYVVNKLPDFFDKDAKLICKEIGDGNLNYVFRVKDENSGKTIIVKQAAEELRISKEMKISTDRGRIESEILGLQGELCPGMVPKVYLYDGTMCAFIMEDMIGHYMMRTALCEHKIFPKFADQCSTFLARTLLLTSDIVMEHKHKKELVRSYINPQICEITEDLVYSEPYLNYNSRNNVFEPNREFVEKELYSDKALHLEAAKLKFEFMNNAQSLIHGDLHTGSIFINEEHSFFFDCEFACYAPMAYDIGNIMANMFFAWANGDATIEDPKEKEKFCSWCIDTIEQILDGFKVKFSQLYQSHVTDHMAKSKGFLDWYLQKVIEDTAGCVGLELIRRTVGMANVKDVTSIKNVAARTRAERIIITYAKNCILNRKEFKSGFDFVCAMNKAIAKFQRITIMSILDYATVSLDDDNSALVIIDQTLLPNETKILHLTEQKDIWDAIYLLKVRGAPAIGDAAGIGIYLAAKQIKKTCQDFDSFYSEFAKARDYLDSARPTAVNLSWALKRMDGVVLANKDKSVDEIVELLKKEAIAIVDEDIWICRHIGEYGVELIKDGDGLLTHCNAGQLATAKYGTATAPMYIAHERGMKIKVFSDETRPLLQGARLTAYELHSAGIDVTSICDSAAPTVMRNGWVQAVFVGCDRVAANGDFANKIGTSAVALAAKRFGIPFYVAAPTSTIDLNTKSGKEIVIEQRDGKEVSTMWYQKPMIAEGVKI